MEEELTKLNLKLDSKDTFDERLNNPKEGIRLITYEGGNPNKSRKDRDR